MRHSLSLCAILPLLLGCAATSPSRRLPSYLVGPSWIVNRPNPHTHFIGISSEKIEGNVNQAHKRARAGALREIAEQIDVWLRADVSLDQSKSARSGDNSEYKEHIRTLSRAVLTGWQETNTWHAPDGHYWSMVVLNKNKYYARVNRRINDAVVSVTDALVAAQRGTPASRVRELHRALTILDTLDGTLARGTINGRAIILNTEVPRQLALLLDEISLQANVFSIKLAPLSPAPDTLGCYVSCNGFVDKSLKISWSSPDPRVGLAVRTTRQDGLRRVGMESVPPTSHPITVVATIDLGDMGYDLLQRGFSIPTCSFAVQRETARVYLADRGEFTKALADTLAYHSTVSISNRAEQAHYVLSSHLAQSAPPQQSDGLYWARGDLEISLSSPEGEPLVNVRQSVRTADGLSASRAVTGLRRCALGMAVSSIQGVF